MVGGGGGGGGGVQSHFHVQSNYSVEIVLCCIVVGVTTRIFIFQTMLRTGKLVSLLSLTEFTFCLHDITLAKQHLSNGSTQPNGNNLSF